MMGVVCVGTVDHIRSLWRFAIASYIENFIAGVICQHLFFIATLEKYLKIILANILFFLLGGTHTKPTVQICQLPQERAILDDMNDASKVSKD